MGQRGFAIAAGGVALVSLGLVACGAISTLTTGRAIGNAFKADLNQSSISVRVSLGLTPAQVIGLAERTGEPGVTQQEATLISETALVFDEVTGHGEALSSKQARSDVDSSFEIAEQVGTMDPFDVRVVRGTIYLRWDESSLAAIPWLGAVGTLPGTGSTSQFPGVSSSKHGGWVSVPLSALESLEHRLESIPSVPAQDRAKAEAAAKAIVAGIRKAFSDNLSYANAGDHAKGTEYTLTLQAAPFVEQVLSSFTTFLGDLGLSESSIQKGIEHVVSRIPASMTITADVWVRDGRAQEIDIDLSQFHPSFGIAVPLRILIGQGSPVSAPPTSSPVNLGKIEERFASLMHP